MRRLVSFGLAALVVGISWGCGSTEKTMEDSAGGLKTWQARMQGMTSALSRVLPLTVSAREFNNPKVEKQITADVKALATMAHSVEETKDKPSDDPSLKFMAERFSQDMSEAVEQLEKGNRAYARTLIRQSTSYCISCHTRTDQGRTNMKLSSSADLSRLTPLEKADFYLAVRDYDQAIKEFDRMINSPDAQLEDVHRLEVGAMKALAVAVRVKHDPKLARQIVTRIGDAKWAPIYLRLNALAWKGSIDEWEKTQPKNELNSKQQLSMAKDLMRRGWKKNLNSPQSQAGLVYFLRASSVLHDMLQKINKDSIYTEVLYQAGLAAESLRDINLWTLHEAYYESCVRKSPGSYFAKRCYLRLESLILSSYSTYDGTFVPAHVRERLTTLRRLVEKDGEKFLDWGFVD